MEIVGGHRRDRGDVEEIIQFRRLRAKQQAYLELVFRQPLQLLTQFRGLADDIEGQFDPEVTVEYVVETVLNPMSRKTLAVAAEELRGLREGMSPLVSKNQMAYVDAQMKAALTRISSVLRDALDDSLKTLCSYYKVELEAKNRKRTLDSGTAIPSTSIQPSLNAQVNPSKDDDLVH